MCGPWALRGGLEPTRGPERRHMLRDRIGNPTSACFSAPFVLRVQSRVLTEQHRRPNGGAHENFTAAERALS